MSEVLVVRAVPETVCFCFDTSAAGATADKCANSSMAH